MLDRDKQIFITGASEIGDEVSPPCPTCGVRSFIGVRWSGDMQTIHLSVMEGCHCHPPFEFDIGPVSLLSGRLKFEWPRPGSGEEVRR